MLDFSIFLVWKVECLLCDAIYTPTYRIMLQRSSVVIRPINSSQA